VGSFSVISSNVGLGLLCCFFSLNFSSNICSYFSHIAYIQLVDMKTKLYNINQQNTPVLNKYFNFYDVFYMFRTRGFIFRKMVVRTGMVYGYVLHNDISVDDGLHIQRRSHNIIIMI
jgi:hypothetical protein